MWGCCMAHIVAEIRGKCGITNLLLFKEGQHRYSTVEKEALALMLALRHFGVYLSANPFPVRVYADHNPLVFLSRMQN